MGLTGASCAACSGNGRGAIVGIGLGLGLLFFSGTAAGRDATCALRVAVPPGLAAPEWAAPCEAPALA